MARTGGAGRRRDAKTAMRPTRRPVLPSDGMDARHDQVPRPPRSRPGSAPRPAAQAPREVLPDGGKDKRWCRASSPGRRTGWTRRGEACSDGGWKRRRREPRERSHAAFIPRPEGRHPRQDHRSRSGARPAGWSGSRGHGRAGDGLEPTAARALPSEESRRRWEEAWAEVKDLPPGEGLRRAFGAWAEDAEEADRFLEWNRAQRKLERRPSE